MLIYCAALYTRVNGMVQKNSEKHASEVTVLKTEMKKMALELDSLRKALEQKVRSLLTQHSLRISILQVFHG